MPNLLGALGLKPKKTAPKPSAPQGPVASGPGAGPGKDDPAKMIADAQQYQQALAAAMAKIAALTDPAAAKAKAVIQAAVIDAARATAKAGKWLDAVAQLARLDDALQQLTDFLKRLAEVKKKRDALFGNPNKAHVNAEIGAADQLMTTARGHADKTAWTAAEAALVQAEAKCTDGESHARRYAECMQRSAEVQGLVIALKAAGVDETVAAGKKTAADAKARARDYDAAKLGYDEALSAAETQHQGWRTDIVNRANTARTGRGGSFPDVELKRVDDAMTAMDAAIVAHQWRKAVMLYVEALGFVDVAERLAVRAADYADQRALTVADIDALKAQKSLLGQVMSLNQLVVKADALASRANMQMEDGIDALKSISQTCKDLDAVAKASAAYTAARTAADAALAALEKHVAADKIDKELTAIRARLATAGKQAGEVSGGPRGVIQSDAGTQDFAAALDTVKQANADLDNAKKIADGLSGVAAIEKAAAGKPDKKAAEAALDALKKDLAAAHAPPNGDLVGKDLLPVDNAADAARKLIDANKPQEAVRELVLAAQALAEALRKKIEATQNTALREAIDQRMKDLLATPAGAAVAARITEVSKLTQEAAALDRDSQFVPATAKLHAAEAAEKRVNEDVAAWKDYDKLAGEVKALSTARGNAAIKGELEKALADGKKSAEAFDWPAAGRALTAAKNRAQAAALEASAKGGSPNIATIKAEARKLLDSGGTKELDALIERLPANVGARVLDALAEERYQIKFEEEAGGSDGKQALALKGMCKLMSKVPDDVLNNPSLKKISRKGARPFPFYQAGKKEVVMNSHPGQYANPMFPKKPNNVSDAQWQQQQKARRESILPADIEPECQPANDKSEDYFDFNFLHEVAHAIDDAKQFMAARERQAPFGGWISHGGDIDSIAKAVAKAKKFDKTPEQIAYVAAKIAGGQVISPPEPEADVDAFYLAMQDVDDWYAMATSDNVWENQAAVSVLDIDGRIYHCAYKESNTWVSYLKAARSRGITGYQFRAPGEWFSELYAAFKVGKLKKEHPSAAWLKELSI